MTQKVNANLAKLSATALKRSRFFRATLGLALLAGISVSAAPATADGTVTIGSSTVVDFKGWGLMPGTYDRQRPTFADGGTGDETWLPSTGAWSDTNTAAGSYRYNAFKALGFDIGRVYMSPTIGLSNNTLDPARLQDLKDNVQSLKNMGVTKYYIVNWSPPAYMKLPDRVRWGKYDPASPSTSRTTGRRQYLDPAFADGVGYDYVDYYMAVIDELIEAGFGPPAAVSLQNEPEQGTIYDSCQWNFDDSATGGVNARALYRTVVKQLKSRLIAADLRNVTVLYGDNDSYNALVNFAGTPSTNGFSQMEADTAFRDAIGGFSYHTYSTSGDIKEINSAMAKYTGRDRWMTEFSPTYQWGVRTELAPYYKSTAEGGSGNLDLNNALNDVRRMGGDLVDFKSNYWFWWRGWKSSTSPGAEDLIYNGDGKSKIYYVFKELWSRVDPGWKVKTVTTTDPDLRTNNQTLIDTDGSSQWSAPVDIVSFEDGGGSKSCLLLANWKSITSVGGLKGSSARIFVTSGTQNMVEQTGRSISSGTLQGGNLTLPGYSITLIVTAPSTTAGTGLKGEYYSGKTLGTYVTQQIDPQVNFIWGTGSPKNAAGTTMSSVGPDGFSVRWTGQIQAVETGNYKFVTEADDGVKLWVNNVLLIDRWTTSNATVNDSAYIDMVAGQKYNIKLEYFEDTGNARCILWWKRPGAASGEQVPKLQLFPAP